MPELRALLRLLVVAALLVASHVSFALLPTISDYRANVPFKGYTGFYATRALACQAADPLIKQVDPNLHTVMDSAVTCGAYDTDNNPAYSIALEERDGQCPANSALGTGGCSCIGGYVEKDGQCKQNLPQCTPGGTVAGPGYFEMGPSAASGPPMAVCINGCLAMFDGIAPAGSSLKGNVKTYYAKGSYYAWGSSCTASSTVPSSASSSAAVPADTCAAGQAMGTVNGNRVCVDQAGGSPVPPTSGNQASSESTTTTTQNADGTTTTTTTTTTTSAGGGRTTTTSSTTNGTDANGKPTSTTTTSTTGAQADQEAERGKCEKNSSEAGCGGAPKDISGGGLYVPKEATVKGILEGARDTLMASPVGSAVTGFFSVSGGGSCPTSSGTIPWINATVSIDAFCSSFAAVAFLVIRSVLLVIAGWMAFRVAIDH